MLQPTPAEELIQLLISCVDASPEVLDEVLRDLLIAAYPTRVAQNN